MENMVLDQSVLAQDVCDRIEYDFVDMFLVKPLEAVKVKKEFSKPVSNENAKKDENGVEAVDFEKVETEVKEVDSDYRKGIVIKVPLSYTAQQSDEKNSWLPEIKVGNVVVFRDRAGVFFDLVKDSKLIRYYDVVALVK